MQNRPAWILFCLFFSGLAALVYQVIWTRLLGFAFGTTTEAIGTVLAVFFGGMALGNGLAARGLGRVMRPLRVYGLLELAIGVFALVSLPLLWRLEGVYAIAGVEHGPLLTALFRIGFAAVVLLPPTIAMGATLPVVARGLVAEDGSRGRWSAYLYAANTLGAVAGAYLCGFWLIPELGLLYSVVGAAVVNVGVAAAVLGAASPAEVAAETPAERNAASPHFPGRGWYLFVFGISGFVAIGYEIVWAKIFSLVMEGTLYGFSSVLSAYLLGLALGSIAIAPFVDRVRDLPRLFGGLHLAIGASVALGMVAVPWLPWAFRRLVEWSGSESALHLAFALILPIVLLPTALFGAAFPVLIRIYARSASGVGRGMGVAFAVNTTGSIFASLLVGFWWIPALGSDATLYLLLLLDLAAGFLVILRFQTSQGRERLAGAATAAVLVLGVAFAYNGIQLDRALVGRWIPASGLAQYTSSLRSALGQTLLVTEGRNALVSIHEEGWGRRIRTNGMPESGRRYAPPYNAIEVDLLGIFPYLLAKEPERGLVIGFGGGGTLDALAHTDLGEIEVVELEQRVIDAAAELYPDGGMPLEDPRVELHINDGRHYLLMSRHRGDPGYDVIASQPSHPWLAGAANLFTEDFFALVKDNLRSGGVFALWLNGFRIDPESALAVINSFDRVFPGSVLVSVGGPESPWSSLVLLGGPSPLRWNVAAAQARLAEPEIAKLLGHYELGAMEPLLTYFEGRLADFATLEPELRNTDDNAFIETRIPTRYHWGSLDVPAILRRLPDAAPVLPPIEGELDFEKLAETLLGQSSETRPWPLAMRARRLIAAHGSELSETKRALLRARVDLRDPETEAEARATLERLVGQHPDDPAPHRALGMHAAVAKREFRDAAAHFERAFARSGAGRDAFDAARAWHRIDRQRAWRWAARVPERERRAFPRLALYDAERALANDAPRADLDRYYAALQTYRATDEGRSFEGVDATLADLAQRLGDPIAARAYRDADGAKREKRAQQLLEVINRAFTAGEIEKAAPLIAEVRHLAPTELLGLRAEAELARKRGNVAAFEKALEEIERWAPSLRQGQIVTKRIRLLGEEAHPPAPQEWPEAQQSPGAGAAEIPPG